MQWRLFRRQTILQEIGFAQWVELVEWKAEPQFRREGEHVLEVSFGLYNATNYPLTLQFISVDINGQKTDLNLRKSLPPNRTSFVGVSLSITAEQNRLRQESILSLFVEGSIEFITALKVKQTQLFRGGIACDKTSATFVDRTIPTGPNAET